MPSLKQKLAQTDARITSHVCTIPSPAVTQAMAAAGADSVIIDMEHGAIDYGSAHAMIASLAGTSCAPLVRVAEIDEAQVKRVLDLGAEGIVFPLVRTAEDAARAVASMHYPPKGTRGFGPFLAHSHYGTALQDYRAKIESELVCCLLIETAEAVANIDEIVAVDGIDFVYVAQFDLSTALGIPGQFEHPDFLAALDVLEPALDRAGIPRGQVALTRERAEEMFARGYRVIGGFDALWLRAVAAQTQSWCG
jgi:4-hydroxy-2-oxoheptanedioate aldolase